jgi:aspartyl protease family protein
LWLAVVVAGAAALWLLFRLFPGAVYDDWDWLNLVSLVVILAAVSTAVLTARRFRAGEVARNIGIWIGVVLVLVVGYAYQDELGDLWYRIKSEVSPASAIETSANVVTIAEGRDGGFYVFADVQGAEVKFLVDTGASQIVLSPQDARRAGIDVDSLRFDQPAETANGVVMGAPVRLSSIAVGSIRFGDMPAVVNRAEMRTSLLGMTFLRRLESFEFRGRRLLLKAR